MDQGTVSRWERGVDVPRPRREGELRRLLLKEGENLLLTRNLAIVRLDMFPSTLLDRKLRLVELSASAKAHYKSRDIDPNALLGKTFEAHAHQRGHPALLEHLRASGLMKGDALMFRFSLNRQGAGHTTIWEPLVEDGQVIGVLNWVSEYFEFSENAENSIERVDYIPKDGQDLIRLHEGQRVEEIG